MRLIAGLPLPPDVAAKVAEADRLRKLFDDAGEGQYNVLNLVESYQRNSMERTSASVWFAGCSKKTGAIARATTTRTSAGPTAKCASRVASERRSGSEFVQSNEWEAMSGTNHATISISRAAYDQIAAAAKARGIAIAELVRQALDGQLVEVDAPAVP